MSDAKLKLNLFEKTITYWKLDVLSSFTLFTYLTTYSKLNVSITFVDKHY